MAEIVYVLCALTSLACAALLARAWRRTRSRLLMWSALCFLCFTANNVLLYADRVVFPDVSLAVLRAATGAAGVAVLLARAGKPDGAAVVLEQAADADPSDPMPCELVGMLSSWAPEVVSQERGVRGYLDAADRRRGAGDAEAALEDLLRAFELDPTSTEAADAVGAVLSARGRTSAADELARQVKRHRDKRRRRREAHRASPRLA